MKSQLCVTMIELVIVLIITLIIATVAVSSGQDTLTEADVTEVYVEMSTMQKTINTFILQMEMNSDLRPEEGKHYDDTFDSWKNQNVIGEYGYGDNVLTKAEDWYIIYGVAADKKLEKAIYDNSKVRENLGLDSINHSYIVNYETGEVELLRPLVIDSKEVRTYEQVRSVAE